MPIDLSRYDAVTFDCYGTLIDWDTGVANFLGPWSLSSDFEGTIADVIASFAKHQRAQQQSKPFKNYRMVIHDALAAAISELGGRISADELDTFSQSVGTWPAFTDTVDALRQLKRAGKHLGVISNVDNSSFEETHRRLGALIDTVVTAEMVHTYKPDLAMFDALFSALEEDKIERSRVLHLAQSRFHDVAPGNQIDLDVVWIDRRHGRPGHGVTVDSSAEPLARYVSLEAFCNAMFDVQATQVA